MSGRTNEWTERRYPCVWCAKVFHTRLGYKVHAEEEHGQVLTFPASIKERSQMKPSLRTEEERIKELERRVFALEADVMALRALQ